MTPEPCREGGQDLGHIDAGDSLIYVVSVPAAGRYVIRFRVAAPTAAGILSTSFRDTQLGQVLIPSTGDWQQWTTICQTVDLPAGDGGLVIRAISSGWNLNWISIEPDTSGSDVVGKITVGYQGWFACPKDGSPIDCWWHWGQDWGKLPSTTNNTIKAWPDVREYATTFATAYPDLGNGQAAKLYSSFNDQTVDTQFRWMQEYGIDCAALQRFNPNGQEGPTRDAMAQKVRNASEVRGVKFYIMYDVSGWTNMQSELKTDWTSKMSALTASPAYARQGGKPVVCIWGFGFNDNNHPFSTDACLDVINWFKSQGCYVIGGVPTWWHESKNDSRSGYLGVYSAFNMLSPWMVGRIGDMDASDWFYTNAILGDQAYCNANHIDYQPCVLPGDVSAQQRVHGDFMWRQFYNVIRAGCQGIYISMYDEYNEGNQIAKTAENTSQSPTGGFFFNLDEDGTPCSSDYYLRLTNDGGKMLKQQIGLTKTRPTTPMIP